MMQKLQDHPIAPRRTRDKFMVMHDHGKEEGQSTGSRAWASHQVWYKGRARRMADGLGTCSDLAATDLQLMTW